MRELFIPRVGTLRLPDWRENKMYDQAQTLARGYAGEGGPSELRQVSIAKELELHIKHLEEQLVIKKRLQKLLQDNPAIEEFMNLSRGIL